MAIQVPNDKPKAMPHFDYVGCMEDLTTADKWREAFTFEGSWRTVYPGLFKIYSMLSALPQDTAHHLANAIEETLSDAVMNAIAIEEGFRHVSPCPEGNTAEEYEEVLSAAATKGRGLRFGTIEMVDRVTGLEELAKFQHACSRLMDKIHPGMDGD